MSRANSKSSRSKARAKSGKAPAKAKAKSAAWARANLDAMILGLRPRRLEQLRAQIFSASKSLDTDVAWNVARGVLERVNSVKNSLAQKVAPAKAALVKEVTRKAMSVKRRSRSKK